MCVKANLLSFAAICCGVGAVMCGDCIQCSTGPAQMVAIAVVSVCLMAIGLLLLVAAQAAEEKNTSRQKIKRRPTHENWRGDER